MCFKKYQCDIASYADDITTPHKSDSNLNADVSKLGNCTNILFKWFKKNHTKPNGDNLDEHNVKNKNYSA